MLGILLIFLVANFIWFKIDIKKYKLSLNNYSIKKLESEFGVMTYVDEGEGEAIIISHGIFGGYDQGYESLNNLLGEEYRKISISRFGYPGSEVPSEPTPQNQAKVFKELLDELGIEKAYILTTSAGGAAGIRFALDFPDRISGLILLSSGVPDVKRTKEEIKGMMGPPKFILSDFPMWFSMKYFKFVFKSMFSSEINPSIYKTMLPVNPRKQGIEKDTEITNIDMNINFDDYPVENIKEPILVIQAKDDPMVKYESIEIFLKRVKAETVIFETGGHLISGQGDKVSNSIKEFIKKSTPMLCRRRS